MTSHNLTLILKELNCWCLNYRGTIDSVFTDAMTREEQIIKLFGVVKDILESQIKVTEGFQELYDFVNDYFNNLDLQEEVNKKIDIMIEDGTFNRIINEEIFGDLNDKIDEIDLRVIRNANVINNTNGFTQALTDGGKRILVLGDSIAKGTGWTGSEGIVTVWKEKYPNNTYVNAGLNEATLSTTANSASNLYTEWLNISNKNFDYIFINCGINDITIGINNRISYTGTIRNYLSSFNGDTSKSLDSLAVTIGLMRTGAPNAEIYYLTPPTADFNISLYEGIYKLYKRTCRMLGVQVIDMYAYFPRYSVNATMLNDRIHPNQKGYRHMSEIIEHFVNSENSQTENTEVDIIPIDFDLTLLESASYLSCLVAGRNLIRLLVDRLEYTYMNNDFILTNYTNKFVLAHIERLYSNVYFFKFKTENASRFELSYKVYYNGTTFICEQYGTWLDTPTELKDYGIYSPYTIPVSGTFYMLGDTTTYPDLPSDLQGRILIVNANIVYRAIGETVGSVLYNKCVRITPYNLAKEYVFTIIKNVANGAELKNKYSISMTML